MNTKFLSFISFFICGIITYSTSPCQVSGLNNPLYIAPVWNIYKGDFIFHAHSRIYYKNEIHNDQSNAVRAITLWDAQGSVNVRYGLGNLYELGLSQIVYQDAHGGEGGKGYNLPDDIYIRLKLGAFGVGEMPVKFGLQLSSRIPTAKYHNIPLEPYSTKNVAFSVMALASYTQSIQSAEQSFGAHVNFAYLDHNDSGYFLDQSEDILSGESAGVKELVYGAALTYPLSKFNFSLEVYGNRYLKRPPAAAYSRYSYLYMTPGISYSPGYKYSFIFGIDYRISSAKPNITARTITNNTPVFPTWRVNFGVRFRLSSSFQKRPSGKNAEPRLDVTESDEGDVFQKLEKEREEYIKAQEELAKIREERKRMDDILEKLNNVLNEGDGTKKQN